MNVDVNILFLQARELEGGGDEVLFLVFVDVHPGESVELVSGLREETGEIESLPWSQRPRGGSVTLLSLDLLVVVSASSVERFVEETVEVREGVEGLVDLEVSHLAVCKGVKSVSVESSSVQMSSCVFELLY